MKMQFHILLLQDSVDPSSTFDGISKILLVLGAIIGIIGAGVIFYNWSHGKKDIERDLALWFGGLLLLMMAQAFFRTMFGL
ncbi:MAG: DUF4134 family protein [Bacteroidetes bacterium]|nr:DUF4134 family protein [Bacteroidota bacterium]